MTQRQYIGLCGSLLLFFGVFAPIIRVPILGTMNYIGGGSRDGITLMLLAIISTSLIFSKKWYRAVWVPGLGSILFLAWRITDLYRTMRGAEAGGRIDLPDDPLSNLLQAIAHSVLASIQLEWGWGILAVGSTMIVIAGCMKDNVKPAPETKGV